MLIKIFLKGLFLKFYFLFLATNTFIFLLNIMEIKPLEFKELNHVSYIDIRKKYEEVFNSNSVRLSEVELKSILALLFSIRFHWSEDKEQNTKMYFAVINEGIPLINTTRDFGRHLIENLDRVKQEQLKSLSNEMYELKNIMINHKLVDFVEMNLVDYMTFRSFEYGRFFMRRFSKEVMSFLKLDLKSNHINNALKDQSYPLKKIAEKVHKSNSFLSTHDELLLAFLLEENLLKTKLSPIQYGLVAYIAKENILKINLKIRIYKQTIDKILDMRWNLNKGMGGPRRG